MEYQDTFKRFEIKYLLNREQKKNLSAVMKQHMTLDEYGRTTICNVYYDTPDSILIRRSLDKPVYKEKLRVRSYGIAKKDGRVFIELKKKYKSVVYKRRISTTQAEAVNYLEHGIKLKECSQITSEIDYFIKYYKNLIPAVYLSYEREAFYGNDDRNLRITFDENILFRTDNISLCERPYGSPVLDENQTLVEIKITSAMPLWLAHALSDNGIYPVSFSKYGRAYMKMQQNNEELITGGKQYA